VNVLATSLTYFIGRIFDTIPIKYDLVLIDVLDDIESVFYGLSYFFLRISFSGAGTSGLEGCQALLSTVPGGGEAFVSLEIDSKKFTRGT
jgi:hypothetical protein